MSARLVSMAFGAASQLQLKNAEAMVLVRIADIADDDGGNVWASNDYIGHFTGLHPDSVSRSIRKLRSLGVIERHRRVGTTSMTVVVVEELDHLNRLRRASWDNERPTKTPDPQVRTTPTPRSEREQPTSSRSDSYVRTGADPQVGTVLTPTSGPFRPPGQTISESYQLAEQPASNSEVPAATFACGDVSAAIASVSDLDSTLRCDARNKPTAETVCAKCDGKTWYLPDFSDSAKDCPQCTPF